MLESSVHETSIARASYVLEYFVLESFVLDSKKHRLHVMESSVLGQREVSTRSVHGGTCKICMYSALACGGSMT